MDTWNREELYKEIWEQPMLKLAPKYGISSVMLGKVCRKLRIPVPGRGYWARKESGQPVSCKPLPAAKNLPTVHRFKHPPSDSLLVNEPAPEPTDPEYLRISEVASLSLSVDHDAPLHRLVAATAKAFRSKRTDNLGYLTTGAYDGAINLNVSSGTFERAILILNAVVTALETEGFPVRISREVRQSSVAIFGMIALKKHQIVAAAGFLSRTLHVGRKL